VPSAVIHQLSIYKPEGITDPETPHEGDSVLITDGAFEGLQAILPNRTAKPAPCCC
jgi:transcriptional antiterminator RfaH